LTDNKDGVSLHITYCSHVYTDRQTWWHNANEHHMDKLKETRNHWPKQPKSNRTSC